MSLLRSIFPTLTFGEALVAALDILIVYFVVYRALLLIKGTRAAQMLIALVFVAAGFYAAKFFDLSTLSWLLDNLISYSIIFFIVIFQSDIRRGLTRVGQNLFSVGYRGEQSSVIEEVVKAAERLARLHQGALIVLEREADLTDYFTDAGVEVDGKVTEELLVSLFLVDPENKLHDGAVIIRNLRIAQAGALLPLSANGKLDKALGTRHRAALGISEDTDAVVVVISEERGLTSLCFGGNIARNVDASALRKALIGLFQKDAVPKTRSGRAYQSFWSFVARRLGKNEETVVVSEHSVVKEQLEGHSVITDRASTVIETTIVSADGAVSARGEEGKTEPSAVVTVVSPPRGTS
jgi:diadenylate cyclase